MRFVIFALLVAMPIVEISVIVSVGSAIGVLPTIALVILTAVVGTMLLRRQGVEALARLRRDIDRREVPAGAIGQAVCVAIAGILLLTPGFITDAFGLALFIPAVRSALWRGLSKSVKVHTAGGAGPGFTHPGQGPSGSRPGPNRRGQTIDLDEGEYQGRPPDA